MDHEALPKTAQITLSYGEGNGPDIMEAALQVMVEAGALLEIETVQLGYEQERLGFEKGFDHEVLSKIHCSHVLLKGPTSGNITAELCKALKIDSAKETYGMSDDAAQSFHNDDYAIFEPAHAHDIESDDPRAMINAAIMMLKHVGQKDVADRIAAAMNKAPITDDMAPEQMAQLIINNFTWK